MSEGFEKVGSLGQLVCGFSIPVWLWRIACFTTDFHSFLTGNWLFAVNVRKCCSKLYLIKISCRNPVKGLSSLFMKSYSLDKKLSESRLHSFPKNNYFLLSISEMMGWMPSILSHKSDLVEILSHWIFFITKCWNSLKTWRSARFKLFQSSHPYNNVGITIFRYRLGLYN